MAVRLFINLIEDQTPARLPPEAVPFRAPNPMPELREWQAIEKIYREGLFADADHTGLLSPKFPVKTRVSYARALSFVADNPGHDVYFFDHGSHLRYYNFNIFERCENAFPGYGAKFIECFGQIGEDVDFASLGRSLPDNTVNGNFWIGNARFWREVIGDAIRLIEAIRAWPAVWRYLCEPVIFNGRVYPYLPFVFERFVSYWLMTRGGLSVKAYPYDRDELHALCVRPLERQFVAGFRDLFDAWDEAGRWSPDRQAFIRDVSSAVHRYLRSSNAHMTSPWSGERIQPVK